MLFAKKDKDRNPRKITVPLFFLTVVFPTQDSGLEAAVRGLPGAVIGTEDCLHLAVHTPELPSGDHNPKLPVMVNTNNFLGRDLRIIEQIL